MKTIVHRSAAIVTFLGLLGVSLHAPQLDHLARLADLLVVAPRRKTLAQLAAQEPDGIDPSNLADFFRISPWDPDDLRLPSIEFILAYLRRRPERNGLPLYFTLDDSLTPQGQEHAPPGGHRLAFRPQPEAHHQGRL